MDNRKRKAALLVTNSGVCAVERKALAIQIQLRCFADEVLNGLLLEQLPWKLPAVAIAHDSRDSERLKKLREVVRDSRGLERRFANTGDDCPAVRKWEGCLSVSV